MKRLSLILMAIALWSYTSKKDDLQVILQVERGYGPFNGGRTILWPLPEKIVAMGVPASVKEYVVRQISLHPEQQYYNYYKRGIINKEFFLHMIRNKNIDTTILSESPTDHIIDIIIGSDEKSDRVIIVDANNNEDFGDDELFSYKYQISVEEQKKIERSMPVQNITYEYYDGRKVLERTLLLKPSPYKMNLNLEHKSKDPIENEYFLFAGASEHRSGGFRIGEREYRVSAANGFVTGDYKSHNTAIFIYPSNSVPSESAGDIPYKVGDVVNLEKKDYKIASISLYGDTVNLAYIGKNDKPKGVTEGLFIPDLQAQTIQNKRFHITDYKGKYVLLDFWGTWCKPCIEAIPELKWLDAQFKEKGLVTVSVAYDKDVQKVKSFTQKKGMDWVHVFESQEDSKESLWVNQLKVQAFPTTILVSPTGKIIARGKNIEELNRILREELKGI